LEPSINEAFNMAIKRNTNPLVEVPNTESLTPVITEIKQEKPSVTREARYEKKVIKNHPKPSQMDL
jgi:hypothetical protein